MRLAGFLFLFKYTQNLHFGLCLVFGTVKNYAIRCIML
jgi:hypothetical protein